VFYFSQKYRGIDAVFAQGQPTKHLECLYNSRMGVKQSDPYCMTNGYPAGPDFGQVPHKSSLEGGIGLAPNQVLVNFLDNHDLPRFMFEKSDFAIQRVALMYLMTWDGIPCVYYGTEQGFAGGVDPKNREDMFAGNDALAYAPFATDHEHFALVQSLIKMRADTVALRRGSVQPIWSTAIEGARRDAGIFAFERVAMGEPTAVVVLNASNQSSESCAPQADGGLCMKTTLPAGTVLTDVMPGTDGATFTVRGDGTVAVTVPARSGRVLVKK
jgi:glycosidase